MTPLSAVLPCPPRTARSWPPTDSTKEGSDLSGSGLFCSDETCGTLTDAPSAASAQEQHTGDGAADALATSDNLVDCDLVDPASDCTILVPWQTEDPSDASRPSPFAALALPLPAETGVTKALPPRTKPKKFSDEAMRVIEEAEVLLNDHGVKTTSHERVLQEIAVLKKRYGRSANASRSSSTSPSEPSRCVIVRTHRRYSLSSNARSVLKAWVDAHINDPYPSVQGAHDTGRFLVRLLACRGRPTPVCPRTSSPPHAASIRSVHRASSIVSSCPTR